MAGRAAGSISLLMTKANRGGKLVPWSLFSAQASEECKQQRGGVIAGGNTNATPGPQSLSGLNPLLTTVGNWEVGQSSRVSRWSRVLLELGWPMNRSPGSPGDRGLGKGCWAPSQSGSSSPITSFSFSPPEPGTGQARAQELRTIQVSGRQRADARESQVPMTGGRLCGSRFAWQETRAVLPSSALQVSGMERKFHSPFLRDRCHPCNRAAHSAHTAPLSQLLPGRAGSPGVPLVTGHTVPPEIWVWVTVSLLGYLARGCSQIRGAPGLPGFGHQSAWDTPGRTQVPRELDACAPVIIRHLRLLLAEAAVDQGGEEVGEGRTGEIVH